MSERVEASDANSWGTGDRAEALQQFRTLVTTVDGGVYRLDADARFVAVDDAFLELTGHAREALLGEHVSQAFAESDTERFEERLAELRAASEPASEPFALELAVRTADGATCPCDVRVGPLTADGEFDGAVGVVRDRGERTRRRERDRELEQYRALTEAASDVIVTIDAESTIRTINPAVESVFGYEPDELIGESLTTLMPDGLADVHRESLTRYLESGDRTLDWDYVELPGVRADGSEIPLAVSFSETEYEGERYFTGIVRDVSEREARERELERTERRFEAVFEDPNILVGLLEPDGTVLDINGTAMEYVDADLADVTGEPFWETPWWGEGDGGERSDGSQSSADESCESTGVRDDVKRWTERAAAGEYVDFETDLTRPNGERYTLSGYFRPVTDDDGEVVSIIVSDRDVTERKERERELEESERRYRTLVENFPNGSVGLYDEDYTYTVVGGELLDDLGLSPEDVIGTDIYARYPDALVDEIEPHFRAVFDGESNTFEIDLGDRNLSAHTLPVRDADDEIYAGMLVVRDVTERKAYERELERTLDLLNKTERIADVAGWEVDPETEQPYWSDHLFDLLDVDYDEQPSLEEALDVYHTEEDRATVAEAVEEALETGDAFDVEVRFPRPAGDVGWLRVKGDPEVEDGEVVSVRGAVQDVTERKRREQALQESRNQLRALIDVLPVAVFVAEADGEIVEWNEAAEEIWGGEIAESESVAEYERYEAWWADTGEPVEPDEWPLARALRGEEVTDPDEIRIKGFDGEFRTVLNHGMPVRDENGDVSRAVVTLVDITERKEYQRKLEESNERLEQFAYAASHDLQEPLRMVSSYLQLLENRYGDDLDADGREFIEFAVDGAERMKAMIDGLLEYSRVETRGDPLEPVDLNDVFDEVVADLQFRIDDEDAAVTSDELPRVEGDADQLRQVFQNLLDNALEYSGEEPPRVHVGAERAGDEWVLSVEDEGIGLEPADRERIFEVFQRLHSREEHAGTGIGLALCERIVERHDGEIWVESEPGEGSTFSFTLPAADEAEARADG